MIHGVTINLQSVSASPVELSVTSDPTSLETSLSNFVTTFNGLTSAISSQTTFNSSSNQAGLLLGDPVATQIVSNLFDGLNAVVNNGGKFKVLSDIGITVGANDQLSFDQTTFEQAYAEDPTAVQQLFTSTATSTDVTTGKVTSTNTGLAYAFDTAMTQLDDPVSGAVTSAVNTLTAESQGFTDQITHLNALIALHQTQLETQFATMESVLANLKSQSSSLGAISTVSTSDAASSSTASSTSST